MGFKKASQTLQRISDQIDTAKEQAGTFRKDNYGSQAQLKLKKRENHFGLKARDLKRHPIITAFLNTGYLISISICYMIKHK